MTASDATTAPRSALEIDSVSHRYGRAEVLHEVSLSVRQGEFVSFLGPSGCGKTTLLRIVAGFIRPTAGSVRLDGSDVTRIPPHRRPVNMVFQRPSLFPHLDIAENVGFGLRVAGASSTEVERRVSEALELVRLEGFGPRRAHELSGGQMQRVALARALVNRPRVLLLDEPLSALDLRIRLEMESELRRVHRETRATFVYVTHDQGEAMAMSDRVVVFDRGRIEQAGSPEAIYRQPTSVFTARFVGDANVLPVQIDPSTGAARTGEATVPLPSTPEGAGPNRPSGPATLVVRPERVRLGPTTGAGLEGVVLDVAFRGATMAYRIAVSGLAEPVKAEVPIDEGPAMQIGEHVVVSWATADARLLHGRGAGSEAPDT